jgi:hypothetical protein
VVLVQVKIASFEVVRVTMRRTGQTVITEELIRVKTCDRRTGQVARGGQATISANCLSERPLDRRLANGPQQVNNTARLPEASRARALPESAPTELLESHVERVDAGAPATPVGSDQAVEAVAVVNRTKNR